MTKLPEAACHKGVSLETQIAVGQKEIKTLGDNHFG